MEKIAMTADSEPTYIALTKTHLCKRRMVSSPHTAAPSILLYLPQSRMHAVTSSNQRYLITCYVC